MIESAVGRARRRAERDQAPLLPPEREEPAQGRPEAEIGRIDVVHRAGSDAISRVHCDISPDVVRLDKTS